MTEFSYLDIQLELEMKLESHNSFKILKQLQ